MPPPVPTAEFDELNPGPPMAILLRIEPRVVVETERVNMLNLLLGFQLNYCPIGPDSGIVPGAQIIARQSEGASSYHVGIRPLSVDDRGNPGSMLVAGMTFPRTVFYRAIGISCRRIVDGVGEAERLPPSWPPLHLGVQRRLRANVRTFVALK